MKLLRALREESSLPCVLAAFAFVACGTDGSDTASNLAASPDAGFDASSDAVAGGDGSAGCVPDTCIQLGADCGTVPDGCGGTVDCGPCEPGLHCGGAGPNRCGSQPCSPKTCAQVQAACGTVSDGCSSQLDCGDCEFPQTCGGGGVPNQCGCPQQTCYGAHMHSRVFGDAAFQRGGGVAVDSLGNIVIAGQFSGQIDFGGAPLSSAGSSDVFVAKLDSQGKEIWSRRYGDAEAQEAWDVQTDEQRNIIVVGAYKGSISFGATVLTASSGSWDTFILKLDPSGNPLWVVHAEAPKWQGLYNVAVDSEGNVVAVGEIHGAADFGGGPVGTGIDFDILVVKVDANGTHLWSKAFGKEGRQGAWGVSVDASGNIYMTGQILGPVDFGDGLVSPAGDGDGFLLALDPAGDLRWFRVFGADGWQQGEATAVDSLGNVFLTVAYEGKVNLGGGDLGSHPVVGEAAIAKFDPSGQHVWSKRLFNSGTIGQSFRLAVDDTGHVLVTGSTDSSVDFGGGTLPVEGNALVVAKLDTSGDEVWSRAFGSAESSITHSVLAAFQQSWVVLSGQMEGEADFGGGWLTCNGEADAFLLQLTP